MCDTMTKARKLCVLRDVPLFLQVSALFSTAGRVTDQMAWCLSVYVTTMIFKHRPLCTYFLPSKVFLERCQIHIYSNKIQKVKFSPLPSLSKQNIFLYFIYGRVKFIIFTCHTMLLSYNPLLVSVFYSLFSDVETFF